MTKAQWGVPGGANLSGYFYSDMSLILSRRRRGKPGRSEGAWEVAQFQHRSGRCGAIIAGKQVDRGSKVSAIPPVTASNPTRPRMKTLLSALCSAALLLLMGCGTSLAKTSPLPPAAVTPAAAPGKSSASGAPEGGTARVTFSVDASGAIGDVTISKTSGYKALDEYAVNWVRRNWRGPASGSAHRYTVPLTFKRR